MRRSLATMQGVAGREGDKNVNIHGMLYYLRRDQSARVAAWLHHIFTPPLTVRPSRSHANFSIRTLEHFSSL